MNIHILYLENIRVPDLWNEYRYHRLDELQPEFARRGIFVDEGVSVGDFTYVGSEASLHRKVRMGSEAIVAPRAIIGEGSVLGDRVEVAYMACLGSRCRLDDDTYVARNAFLQSDVSLGAFTQVGPRCFLASGVTVGSGTILLEGNRIGNGKPLSIGDNVRIGRGNRIGDCTVGDGVHIGHDNSISGGRVLEDGSHVSSYQTLLGDGKPWRDQSDEIEDYDRWKAERSAAVGRALESEAAGGVETTGLTHEEWQTLRQALHTDDTTIDKPLKI